MATPKPYVAPPPPPPPPPPSLAEAARGPILLIVLGSLLALDTLGYVAFSRTWPVLIIVFGVWKLLERAVSRPSAPELTSTEPGGTGGGLS